MANYDYNNLDMLERIIDQAGTEALHRIYVLIEDPAITPSGELPVCPGCEAHEHGMDIYLDLCQCDCACHGKEGMGNG